MLGFMKKAIFKSFLLAILFYAVTADAGLYKGLDDEGNVVYSDKPFENAQKFTPPSLTIVNTPKAAAKKEVLEEEKTAEFKYTDFDIISPKDNQTIWNEPDLGVAVQLKPALNTAEGHNIWLLMDGKPLVKNSQSLLLPIGRADRGAHQLQAQVRDEAGKIVVRTSTVIVHIKNSVVSR